MSRRSTKKPRSHRTRKVPMSNNSSRSPPHLHQSHNLNRHLLHLPILRVHQSQKEHQTLNPNPSHFLPLLFLKRCLNSLFHLPPPFQYHPSWLTIVRRKEASQRACHHEDCSLFTRTWHTALNGLLNHQLPTSNQPRNG